MRSLVWKFTLAFLLVSVLGMGLFVWLAGQRTRSEFDRFLSARDQTVLVNALSDYYAAHGSWRGIRQELDRNSRLDRYSHDATLADAQQIIVMSAPPYTVDQLLPKLEMAQSTPIKSNGQIAGYLHFPLPNGPLNTNSSSPEANFWQNVGWAAVTSAGIAALTALVVGGLLARTLTRPIRELTAATQAMASGQLDQRVTVRSRDEIGELATSFNQMSSDLARASQLRKQMTADLAHDLRTPLTILRGYMEGLQDGRLPGSPKLYTIMQGEVQHLQRMVEDLRTLSLADFGELPLNRRMVDPAALLERTGLAYIGQAEEQGIALRIAINGKINSEASAETDGEMDEEMYSRPTPGLPSISVDTDRMSQVLNNLVSNALRHTTQGEILLSAMAEEHKVILKVSDTGAGIAAEHLPFVFDRFYRADAARQRNDSDSSGLGLAIAKAIVEAHGGSIAVASTPGQGTTFTIRL